ncbi:hypothetical protein AGABI1DRAFT_116642 [Agaricus bisporus var. burnettii JB137-S8]|uniref:Uncharacterized protein n=1 Tax=Agaricus bisporus var. burnettii (strain JB137-S8 / ATCC MYA-4627 / FGSC 10392) TaxID=597362 RepID=K5WI53_AGABU|nr:uncharacterized protein AGABI1DRAFT_116642 [Agaricus bisporus var. burnettii JB137-S8]EKM74961.1 hypothetical protein AGABI1DRAFT_116642 [Agaricus bisporus var. burnettii JB137-S8]
MQNLTITVDDSSPTFHYSPSPVWSSATPLEDANLSSYFKNTTTHTNTSQAKVTFEFWGSSIQIIGAKSPNHGNFQVQLDDQSFGSARELSTTIVCTKWTFKWKT